MRMDINDPDIRLLFKLDYKIDSTQSSTRFLGRENLVGSGFSIEKAIVGDELSFGGIESGKLVIEIRDEVLKKAFGRNGALECITAQAIYKNGSRITFASRYPIVECVRLDRENYFKITAVSSLKKLDIKGNAVNAYNIYKDAKANTDFLSAINMNFIFQSLRARDSSEVFYYDYQWSPSKWYSIKDFDIPLKWMIEKQVKDKSYYNMVQDYLLKKAAFGVMRYKYDEKGDLKNHLLKPSWFPFYSLHTFYKYLNESINESRVYKEKEKEKMLKSIKDFANKREFKPDDAGRHLDYLNLIDNYTLRTTGTYICLDYYDINLENMVYNCTGSAGMYYNDNGELKLRTVSGFWGSDSGIITLIRNNYGIFGGPTGDERDDMNSKFSWVSYVNYYPGNITIPSNINIKPGDALIICQYDAQKKYLNLYPMLVGRVMHSTDGTTKIYSPTIFHYDMKNGGDEQLLK